MMREEAQIKMLSSFVKKGKFSAMFNNLIGYRASNGFLDPLGESIILHTTCESCLEYGQVKIWGERGFIRRSASWSYLVRSTHILCLAGHWI